MIAESFTAFVDARRLAHGGLADVLVAAQSWLETGKPGQLLVFSDATGRHRDYDFRGSPREVLERASPAGERRRPGRPKLGIVSREVSLLPAHWAWLEQQPNGTSAALRRLALKMGMKPMWKDGVEKACMGVTSLDEILEIAANSTESDLEAMGDNGAVRMSA